MRRSGVQSSPREVFIISTRADMKSSNILKLESWSSLGGFFINSNVRTLSYAPAKQMKMELLSRKMNRFARAIVAETQGPHTQALLMFPT